MISLAEFTNIDALFVASENPIPIAPTLEVADCNNACCISLLTLEFCKAFEICVLL